MSLILCPECGTKISDRATKCPHCGFQSADAERPISEQDKYEIVPIFEYDIEEWKPNRGDLSVISYEDNKSLIEYFGSWETIQVKLPAIAEVIGAMANKEHVMIAKPAFIDLFRLLPLGFWHIMGFPVTLAISGICQLTGRDGLHIPVYAAYAGRDDHALARHIAYWIFLGLAA